MEDRNKYEREKKQNQKCQKREMGSSRKLLAEEGEEMIEKQSERETERGSEAH